MEEKNYRFIDGVEAAESAGTEAGVEAERALARANEARLAPVFANMNEAYGKKIRPRLGNTMPFNYMRERQTLTFMLHPELKETAYNIGYIIGEQVCSDMIRGKSLSEIMDSNSPIAEKDGYAFEEIVEADDTHAVYRHYECADCYGLPVIGDRICVYEAGVAAGMFSTALGKRVRVTERKCCAAGDEYCEFFVEVL